LAPPWLQGQADGSRVLRGGSWNNNQRNARCTYLNRNNSDTRNNNIGFRVAASHGIPPWPEMSRVYGRVTEAIKGELARPVPGWGAVPGRGNPRRI